MKPPARILIDNEVELHPLVERDAPELFQLIEEGRSSLRTWLPWIDYTQSVEDERAFIRTVQQQSTEHKSYSFSIWYQGTIAGTIGYHLIDWMNRKVEIGYWQGEAFQGKGIMTRACRSIIQYAFNTLQLNKVEIRCATQNTRSCAIPLRLGFTYEGTIRQAEWLYDHYVDLKLYGLLEHEWQQQEI
ncbi:MAG TPA: GNAT family protein [Dictyobacter sp.]|jgi:ribosomal-protein-serine acetyltransferase|nr:GNAT family protein [Dictyobacter sp.]